MKSGIFLLVLLAIAAIAIEVLKKQTPKKGQHKYKQLDDLFTPAEKSFLLALEAAVGNKIRIYGKVRVADILTPDLSRQAKTWMTAFNKISAKHFDYVLCHPKTLKVLATIELDDKSHNKSNRRARDKFLEEACKSADLRLIRFKAKRTYKIEEIRETIKNELLPKQDETKTIQKNDSKKIA